MGIRGEAMGRDSLERDCHYTVAPPPSRSSESIYMSSISEEAKKFLVKKVLLEHEIVR